MLHLYAALAEKERRLISERTKAALAAKQASGAKLAIRATFRSPERRVGPRRPLQLTNSRPA
jgi:DNA invertase Pin-like site-specific DNA recombinase